MFVVIDLNECILLWFTAEGFLSAHEWRHDEPKNEKKRAKLEEPHVKWVKPTIPCWSIWDKDHEGFANDPKENGHDEDEGTYESNGLAAFALATEITAIHCTVQIFEY
eukprot:CAMPEP_0169112014 /NCGR_PEP_ID=MMETSP1015-20121227/27397_1 /TAXON_ID=342587 /ORGANISM="Karlodinium micrum, Strain CCMP2283" /LENGTH=107 /DNA_ID=CAMNT_0009173999 /DNA_START=216 /DNA_END=539 /DNA_ORIENTATION=-